MDDLEKAQAFLTSKDKPKVRMEKWAYVIRDGGLLNLWGEAHGHPRFADGTPVLTSDIVGINPEVTPVEVETRNTVYVLGERG